MLDKENIYKKACNIMKDAGNPALTLLRKANKGKNIKEILAALNEATRVLKTSPEYKLKTPAELIKKIKSK